VNEYVFSLVVITGPAETKLTRRNSFSAISQL